MEWFRYLHKMVSVGSNTINSNQSIVNRVLQESKESCYAGCTNTINGATIIVIGGSGDVEIKQECKISNIQCIMSTTLNTQIENVLKEMNKQTSSAQSGFSFDFTLASNTINLYQTIENTITQLMDSSCKFEAGNEATGTYFYVEGRDGKVSLSQSASITNASCNMDNLAKVVTYNTETADNDQKATITNIFSLIFVALIVAIIVCGVVASVFFLTGGVSTIVNSKAAETAVKTGLAVETGGASTLVS